VRDHLIGEQRRPEVEQSRPELVQMWLEPARRLSTLFVRRRCPMPALRWQQNSQDRHGANHAQEQRPLLRPTIPAMPHCRAITSAQDAAAMPAGGTPSGAITRRPSWRRSCGNKEGAEGACFWPHEKALHWRWRLLRRFLRPRNRAARHRIQQLSPSDALFHLPSQLVAGEEGRPSRQEERCSRGCGGNFSIRESTAAIEYVSKVCKQFTASSKAYASTLIKRLVTECHTRF
jgi:hypothetical protein